MKVVEKPLTDILPYANNPRRNDAAVDAVAASIREFGFKVPIIVDKDGVIIAGHTRYKAAQKLGLAKVPCVVASDLSPEKVRAFRLADNKVSELAEWDFDALQAEFGEIAGFGINMEDFGFDESDWTSEPEQTGTAPAYDPALYGTPPQTAPGQTLPVAGGQLPPELSGVDLAPTPLAPISGDGRTQTERVIIVFKPEQRQDLQKLLGIEVTNIVYNLDEIVKMRGGL